MRKSDEELAELGWSRCSNCGAIRSPYTGLDFRNHATEDCIYSTEMKKSVSKRNSGKTPPPRRRS